MPRTKAQPTEFVEEFDEEMEEVPIVEPPAEEAPAGAVQYKGTVFYLDNNGFGWSLSIITSDRAELRAEQKQLSEELFEEGCKPQPRDTHKTYGTGSGNGSNVTPFPAKTPADVFTPGQKPPAAGAPQDEALPCDECGQYKIKGFPGRDGFVSAQTSFNAMKKKLGRALCYGCKKAAGMV